MHCLLPSRDHPRRLPCLQNLLFPGESVRNKRERESRNGSYRELEVFEIRGKEGRARGTGGEWRAENGERGGERIKREEGGGKYTARTSFWFSNLF